MSNENIKDPTTASEAGAELTLPEVGGREIEELPAGALDEVDGGGGVGIGVVSHGISIVISRD